ncbi:hypothetical protein [Polyangium aurulentum]|uniref:hypothetical protein n=1 Tax=Polyangium aurulentum TaxID=2567896 RepID=UPI0010AE9FFF|nr:hypothetical protein [Polyangium aurulentum]UQA56164.1 hypothetical protein E8A73_033330 [Polyangium aurulentum]
MADRVDELWLHNGAHLYRFEPPDLLRSRPVGLISREELSTSLDIIELHGRKAPLFWIVDLSRLGGIAPNARRLLSERDARSLLRAIVLVGGSFQQRVLATLAIRAVRLFWRHKTHVPFHFFATEAEGRAWVEAERRGHPPPRGCGPAPRDTSLGAAQG